MFNWLLGQKSKTQLGVDLGSSAVKIVELGRREERPYLANYAIAQLKRDAVFSVIDMKDEEIVSVLAAMIKEANFSGRRANVSLPVDKTFSTVISLPAMPEKELAAAVSFEAQKYVPLPMEEVVLDWTIISSTAEQNADLNTRIQTQISGASENNSTQPPLNLRGGAAPPQRAGQGGVITGGEVDAITSAVPLPKLTGLSAGGPQGTEDATSAGDSNSTSGNVGIGTVQILLLAVPKEIITRVAKIISQAGLKVAALEQEAFSLARSLIGNDKNAFMVIDLGRRGTDIIILDQGFIKLSHNLESVNKEIILMEVDRIVNIFQMRYNKKIGQCLLTGGRANEKELLDFLANKLKISVRIGDPFARVVCDQAVAGFLKELAPQLAVAAGLAMREQ